MTKRKQRDPTQPFKRQSLVTIEMDEIEALLFAPEELAEVKAKRPGHLMDIPSDAVTRHYIVSTKRHDSGVWDVEVQCGSEAMRLPGKVVERIIRQRESIITEQRSVRSQEAAERRKAKDRSDQPSRLDEYLQDAS